ncbi:hypothetical protein RKD30_002702 [Streptomyces pristinaespiralis]
MFSPGRIVFGARAVSRAGRGVRSSPCRTSCGLGPVRTPPGSAPCRTRCALVPVAGQLLRRVTVHEASATPAATVNTAGQAPTFLASGCDPANAAT